MSPSLEIARPDAAEFHAHFEKYVRLVPDGDLRAHLAREAPVTLALIEGAGESRRFHRYAPGKWSVQEVAVHIADFERVFAYRALTFARTPGVSLPSFDEEIWTPAAGADARPLLDVVEEVRAVRAATLALLGSLDAGRMARVGEANGHPMSVRAAFWCIAGHELHHRAILRERYGLAG